MMFGECASHHDTGSEATIVRPGGSSIEIMYESSVQKNARGRQPHVPRQSRGRKRVMLASCDVNGRLDPFVIAVVVNETNVSRFTKVRQAWRANLAERKFELVPVAGIVCEDPGS